MRHTSIRLRLTLSYLTILLLGMALAALLAWLSVEQLYLSTQRENLLVQARLTADALQGSPLPSNPVEPYSQAMNVPPRAPMIGPQITSRTVRVQVQSLMSA